MNKKKITKRIIILSALCIALLILFSSCGNNRVDPTEGTWDKYFETATEKDTEKNEEGSSGESSESSEDASAGAETSETGTEGTYSETETTDTETETVTTEVESSETESTKAESTEAESTEAESTEAESTEAESTEAESTEAATTETESTETETTETEKEADEVVFFGVAEPVKYLSAGSAEAETDSEGDAQENANAETENNGENDEKKPEVDLGLESFNFLDWILWGIGQAMRWVTKIMPGHPYLITLLLFAIVMEILFLPFGIKQHKNSLKQALLKPKEVAIRRRYAGRNDQATMQKLNQEIQELYQKENYSPFAGCLPMLIQLPALIIIYSIVVNPMRYVLGLSGDFMSFMYNYLKFRGVGVSDEPIKLLDTIRSLGSDNPIFTADALSEYCGNADKVAAKIQEIFDNPLNLNIGDFSFSNTPNMIFDGRHLGDPMIWLLLLVPILTFVVYFFSMRINRKLSFQPTQSADEKQQACSNTMMDIMMPLMSVWISFSVPAAIGVYWMFKSIIGVVKQFILVKIMPLPKFTEEDYKAAEKELAGKRPKKVEKSANAGKVRSLHHIDDEDYDEHGNYRPVQKEEAVETTAEETNNSKMSEGVSMKGEDDKQQKKFSFRDLFKKKDKEEPKEEDNENENKDEK